jgi:hypothetical protein
MPQTLGLQGLLPNPAAEIDALGPKGWWRLNDTSGTTAVAKVSNNGTYTGTPSLDSGTLAIDGSSFTAGSGNYVTVGGTADSVNASNTAFTMMAFCLTTDIATSGNQVLFEIGGANNGCAMHITGFDDIDCMAWSLVSSTVVIQSRIRLSDYVTTNKIYHIAYGYNAAGPTTVLYVNGESLGTVLNNTGVAVGASAAANGLGGTNGSTRNAAGAYGAGAFPWRGRVGDVAYFDYLLTQDQVRRVARQMMTT